MARTQVLHVDRGFKMSVSYAKQVMRDHCTITWVVEGETIRDTTNVERIEMIAKQSEITRKRELLEEIHTSAEVHGLRFKGPRTATHVPRSVYVACPSPLFLRVCRWPRREYLKAA